MRADFSQGNAEILSKARAGKLTFNWQHTAIPTQLFKLWLSASERGSFGKGVLSEERFLELPSRVWLGSPKPYNSRHSRLPEHFQNSLPLSTAEDTSFFRDDLGEGLSELVMSEECKVLIFWSIWSFDTQALCILSADDLGNFSEIL